ncbi:hypothetical protein RhiirA5_417599 [Rhizophagus irregularis]|uniref:TLDc domain-containing protein n=1 Tax=Rhizophagus irregularis TaxID=588596 RepID=A0A2N0PM89_9GLOM|nr:hypothetical protein RhiirA5_417599 [Rhizophagus irregularis]
MWKSGNYISGSHNEYGKTKDSFIFSFNNKDNIKNHILSRVVNEKYAIDNFFLFGPSFGIEDLKICEGVESSFIDYASNCCVRESYEKRIRETDGNFAIEEYEVFQIIKDHGCLNNQNHFE